MQSASKLAHSTDIRKLMLKLKGVYEPPAKSDGMRILVERLWPRGLTKERAVIDLWLKDIAPSSELRKWFSHDVKKWEQFKKRYWTELARNPDAVNLLKQKSKEGIVTLVYAAKDEKHNSAVILAKFLARHR